MYKVDKLKKYVFLMKKKIYYEFLKRNNYNDNIELKNRELMVIF